MDDMPTCNCSDCNNFINGEMVDYVIVRCNKLGMTNWHEHCMYHNRAREYIMKDVIEELEQRKTLYPIQGDAYSIGKIDGFDESIYLIKNGVGKK
jgi:hypothetical protein